MPAKKRDKDSSGTAQVQFLTVVRSGHDDAGVQDDGLPSVHNGELPAVRVGKSFRVPEKAVHGYLEGAYFDAG